MFKTDISTIKEKYEKINWELIYLKTPDQIIDKFEELSQKNEIWGYRGQSGNYPTLIPSLERIFSNVCFKNNHEERKVKLRFESQSVELFSRALIANKEDIKDKGIFDYVSILGLLQHYDGITRLLDWSFSPFTALYFAVAANPEDDGAIWSFRYDKYKSKASDKWESLDPQMATNNWINAFDAKSEADWFVCEFLGYKFPRLYAQNGFFSMTSQFGKDHAIKIAELIEDKKDYCVYYFDKSCKNKLRRYLFEKLHIWHGSIYPDITGAGFGIKEVLSDQANLMSRSHMHKYFSFFSYLLPKNI